MKNPKNQPIRAWILANRGAMARIAKQFEVTIQFVHSIAYGKGQRSKNLRVERALKAAGCPIAPPPRLNE